MDKKIRIGLVGTSGFAELIHIPAIQNHPQAQLVSICGRRIERAEEVARKFGIQRAYDNYQAQIMNDALDAIVIATPDDMHFEVALCALKAKMHVLCEKPMGLNVEQAQEMAEVAQRAGVIHMVNFSWRWAPLYWYVRDLIGEGRIGKPFFLNMAYHASHGLHLEGWRFDADRAMGALGDLGSHMVHVGTLIGGEVKTVSASLRSFSVDESDAASTTQPANTSACLLVEYASGVQGMIHVSAVTHLGAEGQQQTIEVSGSDGTLSGTMSLRSSGLSLVRRGCDEPEELSIPALHWQQVDRNKDHFGQLIELFVSQPAGSRALVDAIVGDFTDYPDFQDGLQVQKAIAAAFESDRTGKKVVVS